MSKRKFRNRFCGKSNRVPWAVDLQKDVKGKNLEGRIYTSAELSQAELRALVPSLCPEKYFRSVPLEEQSKWLEKNFKRRQH